MSEQQSAAWLPGEVEMFRDEPGVVLVCCDRCWPSVTLAEATCEPPADLTEAPCDQTEPRVWQLRIVTRHGTNHVRDPEEEDTPLHAFHWTREQIKDPPTGQTTDRPRPRGVTLRCRRCKRVRNHSLRRIFRLAEAAYLAGTAWSGVPEVGIRIYP